MKFHYTAFGIPIESGIELPALSKLASDIGTDIKPIIISEKKVPEQLKEKALGHNQYGAFNRNESIIHIKDTAAFYVCDGSSIDVEPFTEYVDPINQQIYSNCLTIALLQRDMVLFHCSGIFIAEGEVLLFAAPKATGKSTLSVMLQQRGYLPFTDDTTALSFQNGDCFAQPSYPLLRLDDHSISRQNFYSFSGGQMKYRAADGKSAFYFHQKFRTGKVRVRGIVFLECQGQEMLTRKLPASDQVKLLGTNIYRRDWLRQLRMEKQEVEFIGNCAAIPMWMAVRPAGSDTYASFAKMIDEKIIYKILAS